MSVPTYGPKVLLFVAAGAILLYQLGKDDPSSRPVGTRTMTVAAVDVKPPPPPAWRDVALDFNWRKGGFGAVAVVSFTFKNNSTARVWDIQVSCAFYAKSGTRLGSRTMTIYETVEPGKSKRVKDLSFSFVDQQAANGGCEIVGAQEGPALPPAKAKTGIKT